jgi:type III restriction enzyme
MFQLKSYQQQSLDALRAYFREIDTLNDIDFAFQRVTEETLGRRIQYCPVEGLSGIPYVCIRIPTGGGKTFVAAHSIDVVERELLAVDHTMVLWLVPTTTILEQTFEALSDPSHPYRQALNQNANGQVRVMRLRDALEVNRATLDGKTTIVVATMQSFRVEDTDGRKVYEDAGALMEHFRDLDAEQKQRLECLEDGTPKRSLANVLSLRRPIVIVDEAHHARTDLSFETLQRFSPSCIIEFTATPHREDRQSNVLYSVSAAELKAEEMIKLPLELTVAQPWTSALNHAIEQLDHLRDVANKEETETGEYIRPVMLIKAEADRSDDSVTVDVVEKCLREDHKIPEEQIAIATGSSDDLEDADILDPSCPIRFVITIQKLGEGWDCPFAYVLCSVAAMRSNQAVEQIVGRVLRLPNVSRKVHDDLNRAYAFGNDEDFAGALRAMHDVLVENGFDRLEAETLVSPSDQQRQRMLDDGRNGGAGPLFDQEPEPQVHIELKAQPDFSNVPEEVRRNVSYDAKTGRMIYRGSMSDKQRDALKTAVVDPSEHYQIDEAQKRLKSQSGETVRAPVDRGERLTVPKLMIKQGDAFEEFRRTHFVDYNWSLLDFEAVIEISYEPSRQRVQRGQIDTDEEGSLRITSLDQLQRDLAGLGRKQAWNVSELVTWLDRSIPHQDIPASQARPWLTKLVQRYLMDERGFELDHLVRDKARLKRRVEERIDACRAKAQEQRYQELLFDNAAALSVDDSHTFTFGPDYVYRRLYAGEYTFAKHYYDHIDDMNNEEADCADFLDCHPAVKYWVRNVERKPQHSFWLQTSTDRFYPDFVCKLTDGRTLVVEYKGRDRWSNDDSKEKRALGEVWAKQSNGNCLFIMPKGKDLDAINAAIGV